MPAGPVTSPGAISIFAQTVAEATGLDPRVVMTWVRAEGGPATNPLNIMDPATHKPRTYSSPGAAAQATAQLLLTDPRYVLVRRAAAYPDPKRQLDAIAASPWDACHYRGTNPDGTCVNASQGSLLHGIWATISGAAGAVGGAAGGAAGAVGGLWGGVTGIPGAIEAGVHDVEGWAANAALMALAYVLLTVGALALVLLGLNRVTGGGAGRLASLAAASKAGGMGEIPF